MEEKVRSFAETWAIFREDYFISLLQEQKKHFQTKTNILNAEFSFSR